MNQDPMLFSPVEGAYAVLSVDGVFNQVSLYSYRDRLYAHLKKGFVQLKADNLTSVKHTRWIAVEGVEYDPEYNGLKLVN